MPDPGEKDSWWPPERPWVPPSDEEAEHEHKGAKTRALKPKGERTRRKVTANKPEPQIQVQVYVQTGEDTPEKKTGLARVVEALKSEPEWTFT